MSNYQYKVLKSIGTRFWNANQDMYVGYVLDIRTQMNIIQLESGKFLVLDTISLTPDLKSDIDQLTNYGKSIEAVIATHPFHTLHFPKFFDAYPTATYYGTPRHIKNQKQIKWAGDVSTEDVQRKWNPEVEMAIPEGTEFVDPPESNHFASMFVYHRASKTLHVDDTVMFMENPGCLLRCLGFPQDSMNFHVTLKWNGLNPTANAGYQFKNFIQRKVIDAWDFDNIVTAHAGNMIGGAKAKLQATLDAAEPIFEAHAKKHAGK